MINDRSRSNTLIESKIKKSIKIKTEDLSFLHIK